jgi:hypothetical protein
LYKVADGVFLPYENDDEIKVATTKTEDGKTETTYTKVLKLIPQDSLQWLAMKIKEINSKYEDKNKYMPLIAMGVVVVGIIIAFIIMIMAFKQVEKWQMCTQVVQQAPSLVDKVGSMIK